MSLISCSFFFYFFCSFPLLPLVQIFPFTFYDFLSRSPFTVSRFFPSGLSFWKICFESSDYSFLSFVLNISFLAFRRAPATDRGPVGGGGNGGGSGSGHGNSQPCLELQRKLSENEYTFNLSKFPFQLDPSVCLFPWTWIGKRVELLAACLVQFGRISNDCSPCKWCSANSLSRLHRSQNFSFQKNLSDIYIYEANIWSRSKSIVSFRW